MRSILDNINNLVNWQAIIIISLVGFAVFSTGLNNQFLGDDAGQIINNPVVHSLSHIPLMFEGGTFYHNQGIAPLGGAFYRPLAVVAFAFVYTMFGPHAFYFHLLQLIICIASAILLFLIFKSFFNTLLSLMLALIFLVHPINSQNIYAIFNMQDVLFVFFGMLSFWLLTKSRSIRNLCVVSACLFLSLLSKETGVLFVFVCLLYMYLWDRKHLKIFFAILVAPIILYLLLRTNAVGFNTNPYNAPIDSVGLGERLLTVPSILTFYLLKLFWPVKLASGYYWVVSHYSFQWVLLPLITVTLVAAVYIFALKRVRARASNDLFTAFVFFSIWVGAGVMLYLQIIPLDMTASETWLYPSLAGILGMVGVLIVVYQKYIDPRVFTVVFTLVILILGVRAFDRGSNWKNQYVLATHDVYASKEDFNAYNTLLGRDMGNGDFLDALPLTERSLNILPTLPNYLNLAAIQFELGNYAQAGNAYGNALKYNSERQLIMQNRAGLTLFYGDYSSNRQLILDEINHYPKDATLWTYLAILSHRNNDSSNAQAALTQAAKYAPVSQYVYNGIFENQPFTVSLFNKTVDVY